MSDPKNEHDHEHDQGYFKHASAIVDEGAHIGEGTKVWHFSHVCAGARIGRGSTLGQNVYVAPTAVIGDGVKIQNNVSLYDGVVIDDHAFVGPSAVFTNVVNPRSEVSRKDEYRATRVGRGATIGANATVVCGHSIGEYAFVGAGAVVTSDVPPFALVVGVPARAVGWMCRCGLRLAVAATDADADAAAPAATARCACGRAYRLDADRLIEA
jgi:UDP-2-acetamido-3-amino-2,3-dideoxy-glucuronate N-acetyltransferase